MIAASGTGRSGGFAGRLGGRFSGRWAVAATRVTLKQHRLDVGIAAGAALVVGLSAFLVAWRLNSIPMPAGCFEGWVLAPGAPLAPDCAAAVATWNSINDNEASRVFVALAVLPWAAGLLAGIPLVGRELEFGTAAVAWSLSASRRRWLVRRVAPVLVALGATVAFAAAGGSTLEATQHDTEVTHLGLHGWLVVARAVAALGIGLACGAVIGRTLPALVVGAFVCLFLASAVTPLEISWLADHRIVTGPIRGAGYSLGVAYRAPGGTVISVEDAEALAPLGVEQSTGAETWLEEHGYEIVQLGVTPEILAGWTPYEVLGFGSLGTAALCATALVIDRRRPA